MSEQKHIANWGNYPKIKSNVLEPGNSDELIQLVQTTGTVIARGNGRSYGDASLGDNIISTLKLNSIIEFDPTHGTIECEAGILLDQIIREIVPKGYFLNVTPGTKFITLGGAIAANVHGKNHHKEGSFIRSLISLKLINEQGDIVFCSRSENAELFYQTVGGMGTTGIILSAKISLKPIETPYIKYENFIGNNLDEMLQLFEQNNASTYSVAWIDCLAGGKGVLICGEHATQQDLPEKLKKKRYSTDKQKNVPFYFPSFTLSNFSIQLFNKFYFRRKKQQPKIGYATIDAFFYPLDSIHHWNRIYGKNGFIQYQFVLPEANAKNGLKAVFELLNSQNRQPFLTVLKVFGEENEPTNHSFPMKGVTLAMDFKYTSGTEQLVKKLDKIVKQYNGRIYLAKDALSGKDVAILPKRTTDKFTSLQTKRLS